MCYERLGEGAFCRQNRIDRRMTTAIQGKAYEIMLQPEDRLLQKGEREISCAYTDGVKYQASAVVGAKGWKEK